MKNEIIEKFVDSKFTENDIIGLHEETSLVHHLNVNSLDKDLVKEIKSYGRDGYAMFIHEGGLIIYYVKKYNEVWVEGGYDNFYIMRRKHYTK